MSSDTQQNCDDSDASRRTGDDHRHGVTSRLNHHSDNDSGCALEEYSWVPPGLKPEHVGLSKLGICAYDVIRRY